MYKDKTCQDKVIIGYINTLISYIGRFSKSQINKETSELNHTMSHLSLSEVYILVHPTDRTYTFFLEYGNYF